MDHIIRMNQIVVAVFVAVVIVVVHVYADRRSFLGVKNLLNMFFFRGRIRLPSKETRDSTAIPDRILSGRMAGNPHRIETCL